MATLECQFCGAPVTIGEPIPRDAECESCRHDLRCCRNCRHWDPRYNNECTETMADPVEDKARRNFCEYFYFNRAPYTAAVSGKGREAEARAKLAGLFGGAKPKGPESEKPGSAGDSRPSQRQPDARARFDALFKKPETRGDSEE